MTGSLAVVLSSSTASETAHVDYLDGRRGMASLRLLPGPFARNTSGHSSKRRLGVECFFALSGRLMAKICVFLLPAEPFEIINHPRW